MSEMANIGRHGLMELDWGLLRETRNGPGGRVSLPDHRGSRYDSPRWGSWWFEELSAGLAVAGGVRTRTPLGFEHTGFSAIGEPFHERSWTELMEVTGPH